MWYCGRTEIFCLPHLERRETWFEGNSAKLICAILDFPFFCFNWSTDGKEDNMQPLPLSFPIAINGSIRSAIMTPMSDGVGPSVDFDLRKLATPEFIVLRTSFHPLLGQWRRLWYSAVVVLKNCLLKAKSNQGMKSSREALFPGFIDHARFEEVVEGAAATVTFRLLCLERRNSLLSNFYRTATKWKHLVLARVSSKRRGLDETR